MKYATVPVSKIRSDKEGLNFYSRDPFGERDRSMPESPALTQVLLREIPGTDEYEIIFGHMVVQRLPEDAQIPAIIYAANQVPNEERDRLILEYDRTVGSQLLTIYQRACLVRKLGLNDLQASKILGVSHTVIAKWRKGAALYEEIVEAGHNVPAGLSFYHLVRLTEAAERWVLPLETKEKVNYLEKSAEGEMSVSAFDEFLKANLGAKTEDEDGMKPKGSAKVKRRGGTGSPFNFVGGTGNASEPLKSLIEEVLLEADLIEYVKVDVDEQGELTLAIGPISVLRLKDVAECLTKIDAALSNQASI